MSLTVEKLLTRAAAHLPLADSPQPEQELNISVVATTFEATAIALKKAGVLANRLGARISLTVPQVVPFPLPLESPPVLIEFNEHRYLSIARENCVETSVHIFLCRDRVETLMSVLKPRSLVVLGGRKQWWPTGERRLAWKLRKAGHEVILIETE